MKTVFFKGTAIFSLLMGAVVLWEYVSTLMTDVGAVNLIGLSIRVGGVVLLMTMVGIGFLYRRKWAAVFASIFFSYTALRLLSDFSGMQSGKNWLVVLLFVLFLLPLIGTIKYWVDLKPGGRWYL